MLKRPITYSNNFKMSIVFFLKKEIGSGRIKPNFLPLEIRKEKFVNIQEIYMRQ